MTAAKKGTLNILDGSLKGEQVALGEAGVSMGRNPSCDVVLQDSSVSESHATLSYENGDWSLTDQGSTNGTFLNGEKLEGGEKLSDGDEIKLGDIRISFGSQEPEAGPPAQTETQEPPNRGTASPEKTQENMKETAAPNPVKPATQREGGAVISEDPLEAIQDLASVRQQIMNEVQKVIVGQEDVIDQVLTAFFARGHCVLMGVPGLAKTLLVNTLSGSMALDFQRIQFTPDLMPTDITGTNILEEDAVTGKRVFKFTQGPVFTNMLLADEINRTPPKTQAALLEAMQEKQVSNGTDIYALPQPFLVLATQNPIEQEGTYTLPEAQLDRFIFLVKVDYGSEEEELKVLMDTTREETASVEPVLDGPTVMAYQDLVRSVPITEHVAGYANRLMRATRPDSPDAPEFVKNWLHWGCGPRAGQSMILAAKAHAALNGRFNVSCEDIRAYAYPVLRHRMSLNFAAISEGLDSDAIIKQLIEAVPESVDG